MSNRSDYYFETFGVNNMTAEELDAIARDRAGVVGGMDMGYNLNHGDIKDRHGYRFTWINTQGTGNTGRLVMRGIRPHTKEMIRQGRIRALMALGATEMQASAMSEVRVSFSHEEEVARAALATYRSAAWGTYPRVGGGVNKWRDRHTELAAYFAGLSAPRLDAVKALVDAIHWAR